MALSQCPSYFGVPICWTNQIPGRVIIWQEGLVFPLAQDICPIYQIGYGNMLYLSLGHSCVFLTLIRKGGGWVPGPFAPRPSATRCGSRGTARRSPPASGAGHRRGMERRPRAQKCFRKYKILLRNHWSTKKPNVIANLPLAWIRPR